MKKYALKTRPEMRDALLWNFKLVFLVCYEDFGYMVKLPGIIPFGLSQHPPRH